MTQHSWPIRTVLSDRYIKTRQLKPCPFDGSLDLSLIEWTTRAVSIHCDCCSACGPIGGDLPAAAESWNRRRIAND